jgi:hypothetical protein
MNIRHIPKLTRLIALNQMAIKHALLVPFPSALVVHGPFKHVLPDLAALPCPW